MSLKETLSDLFSKETLESADKYRASLGKVDSAISKLNQVTKDALTPIDALDNSIGSGKKSFDELNSMIERTSISMAKMAERAGAGELAAAILASGNAVASINEQLKKMGETLDESTANIRDYRGEMFNIASSFGEGYEESEKLGKSLAGMSDEISFRSAIGFSELKGALKDATDGMGQMGISYEKLFGTIDTGAGSFKSLEAAILLSRKSGETIRTTMSFLSQAVQRNGMSVEDAVTQYSAFFETAEKSGLKFEEVKNSLNQVAQSYSLLGINADFARPIIETFGRSLADTGLGISNATRLSESLARSFAGVANSYEKAYIMVQKGGLDVGGGGGSALGASIGLRARMLQAEKAGDQSSIGLEMAESMKKTLESMTGGSLINIEEAAEGGEAAKQQYFKQEKLMSSMFGLDQDSASRTIEMLQKLDDTTIMSNKDLKDELGKNIGDQLKNQDKNLGYQQRIAASTENMFASSILTNEILMKIVDTSNAGASSLAEKQFGISSMAYDNTFDIASGMAQTASDIVAQSEGKLIEMASQMAGLSRMSAGEFNLADGTNAASELVKKTIPAAEGVFKSFDFANVLTAGETEIVGAIKDLTTAITSSNLTF